MIQNNLDLSALMSNPKKNLIRRCIVSGDKGADGHHILTRKAYREYKDEQWNIIPLGRCIHSEFHSHGITYVASKYIQVKIWLIKNGWTWVEEEEKWCPPNNTKKESLQFRGKN